MNEESLQEEDENIKREKRDKIILDINNIEGCLQYLEDQLGIDFLSKLLAQNLSSSYLDLVQRTLNDFVNPEKEKQEILVNKNLRYGIKNNNRNFAKLLNEEEITDKETSKVNKI